MQLLGQKCSVCFSFLVLSSQFLVTIFAVSQLLPEVAQLASQLQNSAILLKSFLAL